MRTQVQSSVGLAKLTFACSLSVFLCGCIGVIPVPQQTRTSQGIVEKSVELDFIEPQVTTPTEVREKLKLIDTGLPSNRYFLAR